jgi:phosphoribosylformylglycinamidine cyclo-ligase
VLPEGLAAEIDRAAWDVPAIFTALQEVGGIHAEEMWRTFNMGVGMVVVAPAEHADIVSEAAGVPVRVIGRVLKASSGERVLLR